MIKNIASLDKGEAIVTSIFVPFAMPIKIPLFEDIVKEKGVKPEIRQDKGVLIEICTFV